MNSLKPNIEKNLSDLVKRSSRIDDFIKNAQQMGYSFDDVVSAVNKHYDQEINSAKGIVSRRWKKDTSENKNEVKFKVGEYVVTPKGYGEIVKIEPAVNGQGIAVAYVKMDSNSEIMRFLSPDKNNLFKPGNKLIKEKVVKTTDYTNKIKQLISSAHKRKNSEEVLYYKQAYGKSAIVPFDKFKKSSVYNDWKKSNEKEISKINNGINKTSLLDNKNPNDNKYAPIYCVIKDEFDDIESTAIVTTQAEAIRWFKEHNIKFADTKLLNKDTYLYSKKRQLHENAVQKWYEISKDGVPMAYTKDESSAFKWILNNQSQSVNWAIKYEGWKIKKVNGQNIKDRSKIIMEFILKDKCIDCGHRKELHNPICLSSDCDCALMQETSTSNGSGAGMGIATPNAFTGGINKNEKKRKKSATSSTGYKIVGEN